MCIFVYVCMYVCMYVCRLYKLCMYVCIIYLLITRHRHRQKKRSSDWIVYIYIYIYMASPLTVRVIETVSEPRGPCLKGLFTKNPFQKPL